VRPGEPVAIWGAGPVGLMATMSAMLRGASEVYTVDGVPDRLGKAKEMGAIPIDLTAGRPAEQIKQHRRDNGLVRGAWRQGEDKMDGVMAAVDAVGYQAKADDDPSREMPTQALEDIANVLNATGRLGTVGVYISPDPGAPDEPRKQGRFELPWAAFFDKAIEIGMGQCPVKRYNEHLRDEIIAGRAHPTAYRMR
jgi:glutathione-independent formaldehyde dehydrogenase